MFVDEDHSRWLPILYKDPISHDVLLFLVNVLLLRYPCLTVIKNHAIKYCETVYEMNGKRSIVVIQNFR